MGFRVSVSLHPAIQATGRLTFAPAGLIPAEHTSLRWTHKRTQLVQLVLHEFSQANRSQPPQRAQKHRPTTPEGKRRSRCNAVRHGLTAETVIAAIEDSEDYEAFEAAVISDYDAESAVERELVLRLASVLWRLRRATGIETALFESVTEDSRKHEHLLSRENPAGAADLAERNRLLLGAVQESDAAEGNELSFDSKKDIAGCFLRLADLPTSALDRLSRYEHMLWRQARQIVFTLESLRRRKRQPSRSTFPFSFRRREPSALAEEFR